MLGRSARTVYLRKPVNQNLDKIWEFPMTVVEAPMGYGKTTAVKEYLQTKNAVVLWQTVMDESASGFWNGFCRLFHRLDPVVEEHLNGVGVPGNSVFVEEAVRLVEGVSFAAKTVMVFDDYHLLSSQDLDRFIERLIRAEIPDLYILVISRSVFGDHLPELVLKGYCQVIGKKSFELSRDEIAEYCHLYGIEPAMEDLDFLETYTEGWISAVYLCVLGFLQEGRLERQSSLHELIEHVVYRRVTPAGRDFLMHICIFDHFSLEQAERMWGQGNAEALLRDLVRQNAFIRYDAVEQTYDLHNIFSSFLRRIFDRRETDWKQKIWQRAGQWYVSAGDCIHALDYFYQATDFDALLSAIEQDGGQGIYNEHKDKLIRYFGECPEPVKQAHPQACLIYAINLFSFNEMELFIRQCADIERYIALLPAEPAPEKNQLSGELELLCSFSKYNHIPGMSEHHCRAEKLMTRPSEFIDKRGSLTFGSPSVLYMFYRESGQLEQETAEISTDMERYGRLTAGHGAGAEYVMQAERYYCLGDFENAEILSHTALQAARSQEQTAIVLCALFLQLRLALIKGDVDFVTANLQQSREDLVRQGLYQYIHTWDLCEGFIYGCLNQPQKIPVWIMEGEVEKSTLFFPSYAFFNIVFGKALLIDGQYRKLMGLSENFIGLAGIFPNTLSFIYT
ncbi:MAG TPA: helix-turn-helix transcriptional regulator, partial [Patescibacteria group bacterium]|nr:helix-turn-helix transcriptional regulator [Patescibacteria group bacterium]